MYIYTDDATRLDPHPPTGHPFTTVQTFTTAQVFTGTAVRLLTAGCRLPAVVCVKGFFVLG